MKELEQIVAAAGQAVAVSASVAELELARARVLGKAGSLTELLKGLGRLPPEERPQAGAAVKPAKAEGASPGEGRPGAIPPRGAAGHAAPRATAVTRPGPGA